MDVGDKEKEGQRIAWSLDVYIQ